MLPTFQQHLGRYAVAMWLGISLLCLMLVFALLRNSPSLSLTELLIAAATISFGVSLGALRDAPGYWIYSTLAGKFMMSKAELHQIRNLQFSPLTRWLSPLHNPLALPLLNTLAVGLLIVLGHVLFSRHMTLLTIGVLGLLFPLWLCWLLLAAARYQLVLASPEGETEIHQDKRGARRISNYRREDLVITLSINFALIWPLQGKPAFSLAAGYATPEFIVAALLLIWIAAFFSLLGARRSRLTSVVGERLSQLFLSDSPAPAPRPLRPGLQRLALYYALLAAWAVAICLLLGLLPWTLPFPLFCLLLLPALGWVYWQERGITLQSDAEQAALFIDEQVVQPVAVARRMPEFN
jgi:hypothetical protein